MSADKAYDDGDEVRKFYEEHGIKAVVPLRDTAQDGEDGERLAPGSNVLLGDDGTVYCYHKEGAAIVRQAMVCWSWEKSLGTQKWRCPAAVSGLPCKGRETCSPTKYGRTVRVHAEQDWRRFGPVAHGNKGLHDLAIKDFTKAIDLKPDHAEAYYNRGLAYEAKGNLAEAQADFESARRLGYVR